MFFVLLLDACDHQYLAIPDAEIVEGTPQYAYDNVFVDPLTPTYTVTTGTLDLVTGESVTMEVDFSAAFSFEVTELVFLGLNITEDDSEFGDHWRYTLDSEEIAAKKAEITIYALDAEPTTEWCTPKHLGTWTCYQIADKGIHAIGLSAAGDADLSVFAEVPLTLPSMDTGGVPTDTCSAYTVDDCCAGGDGISVVQCAWDPSCDCPDGTTEIGTDAQGYRLCDCPG